MSIHEQVPADEWKFIEELKTPLHSDINLSRTSIRENEADFSTGLALEKNFSDPEHLLDTAYADFQLFADAAALKEGPYKIITEYSETECFEAYQITISKTECRLQAADTEGIRRALIYLEDEILRADGSFLPLGTINRKPVIKTRISRCFFGPIKRPPMNRDELADDVNYYPDNYLNKLAHEGINTLWLTISFKDLCPSTIYPDNGRDNVKRLAKLRKTAAQCARFGIKIYVFCIEPWGFGEIEEYQSPLSTLERHPDLAGHKSASATYFCTSTKKGQNYLEECTSHIFTNVPELGGLINITLGERPTSCYSAQPNLFKNNCPICSKRTPAEVIADTTSAMIRGMHKGNPDAEMVCWLYAPSMNNADGSIANIKAEMKKIAANTPKGVTLQYNFESLGKATQLGKERVALDYWLAWPGPSDIFKECASSAVSNDARVSAKIQVGCSHEIATIPFIPVPGNLYQKYKAMHELGVSTVMQCWYFGNYPGVMNKSAGELAFAPLPENEEDFLLKLAQTDWAKHGSIVAKAWKSFQNSYTNFPVNLSFTWYGPIHNSIVWPLHLKPADKPISPSWTFTFPLESGDRIGECICYNHTLPETLELLDKMNYHWQQGLVLLADIEEDYRDNAARTLDIYLAKALGIQINSTNNLFHFYALREQLPFINQNKQLASLAEMARIIHAELENCQNLKELCLKDSRLGFHSEAEGYKYDPQQLDRKTKQLQTLLSEDLPKITNHVNSGTPLFPEYTGKTPLGKQYSCPKTPSDARSATLASSQYTWNAYHDEDNLYIEIEGTITDSATVIIEPCRLWPTQQFTVFADGSKHHRNYKVLMDDSWDVERNGNKAIFTIPFKIFDGYYKSGNPMRINVKADDASWVAQNPWPTRLRFGDDNSADLGWLLFD